jgi:hypothetical protein
MNADGIRGRVEQFMASHRGTAAAASDKMKGWLSDPRVQYALAGALAGGLGSLTRSVANDRPVRSTAGKALSSSALGALVGLGGHSLAGVAGYEPPPLLTPGTNKFSALRAVLSIPSRV